MSSAQQSVEATRIEAAAKVARSCILANLESLEPRSVLHTGQCFAQLGWFLNRVPMTREQREEVDDMLKGVGLLFQT